MELKTITLGITNTYIIKGEKGYIMIDAGELRKEKRFSKKISRLGIDPKDINLIIITHAHYDHVGSLAAIKKMCGCPVLMHSREAAILEKGEIAIPPGTNAIGKFFSTMGKFLRPLFAFTPVQAELRCDTEFDLYPYGIKGKVISTPGHTPGSLSVILDDGRAMVGDLAMNFIPGSVYPIFAELPDEVYSSWRLLVDNDVKKIYPAHGESFSIDRIKKLL